MTSLRTLTFAAALAAVASLPAVAQTAQPSADALPPTQVQTPLPDTGVKKVPETPRVHHRVHHHSHAKASPETTPPTANRSR